MAERIVLFLAALATIASFLLQEWRYWKQRRDARKQADDIEKKSNR